MSVKKSIKKKLSVGMVTVLAVTLLITPASARNLQLIPVDDFMCVNYPAVIGLDWSETSSARASISISGRTITSSMSVIAQRNNTRISGTMFLEENRNGTWRSVSSWAVSGTGNANLSRTFTATSGVTYRTRIVVTVGSERIERTSASVRA